MRYVGQSYEVATPVPTGALDAAAVEALSEAFNAVHQREYGVASSDFPVALVTLRVTGIGPTAKPAADALASALGTHEGNGAGSIKERRQAYFGGRHHDVDVHEVDTPERRPGDPRPGDHRAGRRRDRRPARRDRPRRPLRQRDAGGGGMTDGC